ncbi:MAG TPA: biotin attachment protein [Desulfonauticus sp.]|jgi:hypothetical protein|nr:MAG: Biotin/lipoyl attachment domain-containing protein [Desulfonauticus sp. 38_4375]MDK2922233.1 hypothetical protein [Desulfonauticus sp.]HCO11961.1 biotin attachment protein [Desulfonauticus sp.]
MKTSNIKELLDKIKENPYKTIVVKTPHCGTIEFVVGEGEEVKGPRGKYKEQPGTLLAYLTRENNQKPLYAQERGIISKIYPFQKGDFVEANTPILEIKHYLTKEEVLELILKETLYLFRAPEKGKYYFVPEIDKRIKAKGCQKVKLHPGEEVLILSRMKRETFLPYEGPEGIIYHLYFKPGQSLNAEDILFGVCPPEDLESIKEVVLKVKSEWEEK